jgi:CRP-like cAMP-binding protein
MVSETVRRSSRQFRPLNKCSLVESHKFMLRIFPGDIEVLMELPTYMQTAVCTQKCEVLVLELKHFERLFVKRHPRTVDMMKDNLVVRLQSRLSPRLQQTVPLLRCLLDQAIEYRAQKRLQTQVQAMQCVCFRYIDFPLSSFSLRCDDFNYWHL